MSVLAVLTTWNLVLVAEIAAAIVAILSVVGAFAFAFRREELQRPVLPWGARMRVERAQAQLELDALEVKRLAVAHQHTRVLAAIQADDHDQVEALGLPRGGQE